MLSALVDALTDPASFFEREAADPELRGPTIVVGTVAILGLLAAIPTLQATMAAVPRGARGFVVVGAIVGMVFGLVVPFVVWLVYALLFYALSALFGGEGEFRDLFAMVGWGFGPRALAALVSGVVTFVLLPSGGFGDPAAASQFARDVATSPLGLANRVFGLLMTLWAAWVWTHVVAEAREISRRNAAITVGLVVGTGVLIGLATTYLSSVA